MTPIFTFVNGLASFSLGMAVLLEARQSSSLPLGRQLPWLAAFGFVHSLVYWADLFLSTPASQPYAYYLHVARSALLPLSAMLLICFGVGLIRDAGPLKNRWLWLAPLVLFIPLGLILGYALTVVNTEPLLTRATEVWTRYLLYFPGNLLAAAGFLRQRNLLKRDSLDPARKLLLGAAAAFMVHALVSGLVVPSASYGLAPWLNHEWLQSLTGAPVEVWRTLSTLAVTFFVMRSLSVFQFERRERLESLEKACRAAQQATIAAKIRACQTCNTAEDWTEALVGISRKIAEMGGVDQVLLSIVETARNLLVADTAVLALWDESGTRLEVKYFANQEGAGIASSQAVTSPVLLEAVRSCSVRRYPEEAQIEGESLSCMIIGKEIKTAAIVSLKLENQPFGGLWVGRLQNEPFTATDLIGLERLADQAVIAITHSLMADRMQSLAVLEERSRLAREMHDGLAQILGYLRLETQAIEATIKSGELDSSLERLKQARQNIDLAQADVRENILSLRTTLSGKAGVVATLKEFLDEYSIQTGIQVHFVSNLEGEPNLSPIAETQMVRIVQEALANVRKHARAEAVQLRLETCGGHLSVLVTDDGVGFDLTPERGHYGLQTMQERALNVGGAVTINSSPGQGTQVELWLPLFEKSYAA